MSPIVVTPAIIFLLLISLVFESRSNRRRNARLEAISVAPLPRLPLSFRWNWWGIGLFMAIPLFILALVLFVGYSVSASLPIAAPGVLACAASAYYVYGYVRFALRGPSFTLEAGGISFAGNYLRWQDVLAIDYVPSGRTPRIRFRQTASEVAGFSVLDQFYGKTSVSSYFISDPDSLVGWSRRLKEESEKD